MKKENLLKSLLVVLAMSFFSVVALAQATTVGTYKRVTAAPADGDWSGQYLIVCESDGTDSDGGPFILDGSYGVTSGIATYVRSLCNYSLADGTIEVTQAAVEKLSSDNIQMSSSWTCGDFHFTIDKDGHLFSASRYYYGAGTSVGSPARVQDSKVPETGLATNFIHTIAFNSSDNSVAISAVNGTTTRYLRFYVNKTTKKFGYYSATQYRPIHLYKLVENAGGGEVEPETPVDPEPETPVEPEQPEVTGAKLYFDLSLATTYKTAPVVFSNETTTDTVALVAVEGKTNVFEVEVPAGNWTQITLVKKGMNYVLKNYNGVNNLFKSYPAGAFYSATAPTDGDGVWMKYGEDFAVGSDIMAKQVLYFDPTVFGDACDSYDVVFVQTGNTKVTKVAASKLADGKYYATAGSYIYTGFSIRGYKNKQFVASASNLTWDGTGTLCTINADHTGTWSTGYTEPERIINAAWTIAEGAKVEGFSNVQVTFSGIDPKGRLLGDGATEVVYAGTAATFYKLEGETRTPVATLSGASNGVLTAAKVDNFTWEFSIGEAFESFEKGYMREGNYCIVIAGTNLTINPKAGTTTVKGSGEFVLNFTIENDKVFLVPTEMEYELTPAKSVVSEISEVIINFLDAEWIELAADRASGRSATPDPKTCAYIRGAGIEYPMNCEVLKGGYSIALTIASEYTGGVDKITAEGLYTITIPEGMLFFDESDVKVNKEITFAYTVGTPMPANGVIYFDPAGKQAEELSVRFTAANGEVKEANVMNVGGVYRIEMPAGDEWMRFEIAGLDYSTGNAVSVYSITGLVYDGTNNLFTLNADAPVEATTENGVWSKRTVQQIQGGEAFYYSIASSAYFAEATNFIWTTKFMTAAGDEVAAEMELVEAGLYKMVAPEGTWDMFKIVLSTTAREVNNIYFEYDGVHNMFRLGEGASPYALVGTLDVYAAPVVVVAPAAPTFSVAEGEFEEEFILEILPAKDETRDIVILFTTDGTEPNAGRILGEKGTTEMYREGVRISETTTVKAMVVLYDENIENAADFVVSPVTTATYTKKEVAPRVVTATWSIEEGAVLESFTGVTVTFSGIDPLGRKVDGTEVTKVYPIISSVQTFFVVNEDGTTTPVVANEDGYYSGILACSASGVTSTLSLGTDRYTLVDGAFLKNGNYRIVLPANKVQYQPNVDGTKVYGEQDFVLNFSIKNDYVEPVAPTEIEVPFTVSVENNSTVAELSEIVITYPDVAQIRVSAPMPPQAPATWVFLNQTMVDENGNVTAFEAKAPLYWQQVSANSFKIMVGFSAIGGPETLAIEGTYSIDVPAGLVMFSPTEVNKAFSLYYTIEKGEDGPIVNVENVILSDIFVQDGTVVADGEFEIFTITGQNVTRMNGNLQSGVYVVRCGNATAKVVVK